MKTQAPNNSIFKADEMLSKHREYSWKERIIRFTGIIVVGALFPFLEPGFVGQEGFGILILISVFGRQPSGLAVPILWIS